MSPVVISDIAVIVVFRHCGVLIGRLGGCLCLKTKTETEIAVPCSKNNPLNLINASCQFLGDTSAWFPL